MASQVLISILFLVTYSSTVFGAEFIFRNDYKYNKDLKIYYKLHNSHLSWDRAREICDTEGAMLAYPENAAEAKFLSKLSFPDRTLWLGAHNLFLADEFTNLNGENIVNKWMNWQETPEIGEAENNCVALFSRSGMTLRLSNCYQNKSSVCFKRQNDLTCNQACQNYDPYYVPSPEKSECFKVHIEPKTWNEAYTTCQIEGGNLAIINYKYKASFLRDLYKENSRDDSNSFSVFIGYKKILDGQFWMSVLGKLLSRENYIKIVYRDDYQRITGNCATLTNNDDLVGNNCDETHAFICERKLATDKKIIAFLKEDNDDVENAPVTDNTIHLPEIPDEEEY